MTIRSIRVGNQVVTFEYRYYLDDLLVRIIIVQSEASFNHIRRRLESYLREEEISRLQAAVGEGVPYRPRRQNP